MSAPLIYLDHCATTPLTPEVLQAMMPYLQAHYGNASSTAHKAGRVAASAVALAREQVAQLIHAQAEEVSFTSGATESINMAMKAIYERYSLIGNHIITCQTEHPAVLETCRYLETKGAHITYLPVDLRGHLDLSQLEMAISEKTILIALMAANNETGVLHPLKEIGQLAKEKGLLFLCDATQAIGAMPLDVVKDNIDILALSAHKFYGPKGVGLLYVKKRSKRIQVSPLIHGGKQESGLRAGTLNVPAIVGMGKAAELAIPLGQGTPATLAGLRNLLEKSLLSIEGTRLNGDPGKRLPHVSNICFPYLRASEIMTKVPQLALSSGSACATGSLDPSHVLVAMGLSQDQAHASIRFSLGRYTTQEEVQTAIELITRAVGQLHDESPVWQLHKAGLLD